MTKPRRTIEQLRDDIDSGRTRDKVDFPDPAAAPLGSDEEAAGTPVTAPQTRQTRRETTRRSRHKPQTPGLETSPRRANLIILLGAALAALLALLAAAT